MWVVFFCLLLAISVFTASYGVCALTHIFSDPMQEELTSDLSFL